MFNSDEYAWIDMQIFFLGKLVTGIRGITYTASQSKTNIYAKGKKPVARGRGNVEYEGEVMLLQSELEALQAAAGQGKTVLDIRPFDIVVSYAPEGVVNPVTDILKSVEFNEVEKGMVTGDEFKEITLPIVIGDIKYNQ